MAGAAVGYAPSAPEPFTRLPISYDNAFGGTESGCTIRRKSDPILRIQSGAVGTITFIASW